MASSSDKEARMRDSMHQADAAANPPKPPRMHRLGSLAKSYATRKNAHAALDRACSTLPPDTFVPYVILVQEDGRFTPAVIRLATNVLADPHLVGLARRGVLVVG